MKTPTMKRIATGHYTIEHAGRTFKIIGAGRSWSVLESTPQGDQVPAGMLDTYSGRVAARYYLFQLLGLSTR